MQTITKSTTAAELILAIDLGKYKSVACVYRAADELRFLSIPAHVQSRLRTEPMRQWRRSRVPSRSRVRGNAPGADDVTLRGSSLPFCLACMWHGEVSGTRPASHLRLVERVGLREAVVTHKRVRA